MKTIHIFNADDYHHALNPEPRKQFYNQRGAGLGGAFGIVRKYTVPIIKQYVLPHVKDTVVNTAKDIFSGTSVRGAIKKNAVNLIGNVGKDMFSSLSQRGKGITRKQTKSGRKIPLKKVVKPKPKKKASKPKPKKKAVKKKVPKKAVKQKSRKGKSKTDYLS